MGVLMEGFFDGAEAVLAMPAPTAHKTPAKTPIPSAEPVPREGTHVEGVGETTPLPAERPTPSEGAIPPAAVQAKTTSHPASATERRVSHFSPFSFSDKIS